jgi:CDP-4-dehydro-6-deoxyglucose reductase
LVYFENEDMPRKWYHAPVIKIQDLNPRTKQFTIALDDPNTFSFKAGQFITLDLPIGDKRTQRWRSYSIANSDTSGRLLELCVVHLDQGVGSDYLFNSLKPGDFLKFKGPEGGFVLPEVIDHDMIMVCTGTGIAPFRSMLWDIVHKNHPHQGIHLIFGTRDQSGILYQEELDYFKKAIQGFDYSIALSREMHEDYTHGYVHAIYQELFSEYKEDRKFYLCGWTNMVDEAVANLVVEMKNKPTQVKYELYG